MKKRDTNVELLRLFASFIVIGTHVKLTNYVLEGGALNLGQIAISGFFGEGVTIFFFIFGFFMFKNISFKKMCKRTLMNIIIPSIIYIILIQLLKPWIVGECSLLEVYKNISIDFRMIISKLLKQSVSFQYGQHLWYLVSYIQLIMIYPLIRHLKDYDKSRRYIIIIGLIAILLTDIQKVIQLPFPVKPITFITTPVLFALLGYELYLQKDKLKDHSVISMLIGLIFYFLGHFIWLYLKVYVLQNDLDIKYSWDSTVFLLSTTGICIFFLSMNIKQPKLNKVIKLISSRCFIIYLIHFPIIAKLKSLYVYNFFYQNFAERYPNILGELMFTILLSITVFLISFIVSDILLRIKEILKRQLIKYKEKAIA